MMKTFKKSDLTNGHFVETRSGDLGLVVKDNTYGEDAVIFDAGSWTPLEGFNEDLIWHPDSTQKDYCRTIDIVKVYTSDLPTGFLSRRNKFSSGLTLVWNREEEERIPEYTMEELIEKLGHDFKIKK